MALETRRANAAGAKNQAIADQANATESAKSAGAEFAGKGGFREVVEEGGNRLVRDSQIDLLLCGWRKQAYPAHHSSSPSVHWATPNSRRRSPTAHWGFGHMATRARGSGVRHR